MELTARIIEWNREKGYGFLQSGQERVFLHVRDFEERKKTPQVGDTILFRMGVDTQGRKCAVGAAFRNDTGLTHVTHGNLFVLAFLLILPALAIRRYAPNAIAILSYSVGVSILTWVAYAHDKNRARSRKWRVPESSLHILEALGGWPGAFLAQRHLRHKCLKKSYKAVFWIIVIAYQYAALDSLQHWKITSRAVNWVGQIAQRTAATD